MNKCKICSHEWAARDENPKRCARWGDGRLKNRGSSKRRRASKYGWENLEVGQAVKLPILYYHTPGAVHWLADLNEGAMVSRNGVARAWARRHGRAFKIIVSGENVKYMRVR